MSNEAADFASMFGLSRAANPGKKTAKKPKKAAAKKTTKKSATKKAAPKKSAAKKAGAKARKPAAKKAASKKKASTKKTTGKRGTTCAPRTRCHKEPRFEIRRAGSFTGVWDREAGKGNRRGKFVKVSYENCKAVSSANAESVLEVMQSLETAPKDQKATRGPYEIFSVYNAWVVYDRRTAALLTSQGSREEAIKYVVKGGAKRDTCPHPDGYEQRSNPGRTIESRVERLEARTENHEVRLARTETGLSRALGVLTGGGTPQLGSGKKPRAKKSAKKSRAKK